MAPLRILAIDTSTPCASVAALAGGDVLAEEETRTTTHSEKLLALVDAVLARAGLAPGELDAVACGAGPGSFTGLRIGLATAKGLVFATSAKLVLVPSLAALALDGAAAGGQLGDSALLVPVIDARKREVYAGFYLREGAGLRAFADEVALAPEALFERAVHLAREARLSLMIADRAAPEAGHVGTTSSYGAPTGRLVAASPRRGGTGKSPPNDPIVIFGEGATVYADRFRASLAEARDRDHVRVDATLRATPRAARVGELALARLRAGESDDLAQATPRYVRAPDAELPEERAAREARAAEKAAAVATAATGGGRSAPEAPAATSTAGPAGRGRARRPDGARRGRRT